MIYFNEQVFKMGFTFVLNRATNIELRLPDKTFWLPDNINVNTYSKTFGCPTERNGCPRQPATGYVKP